MLTGKTAARVAAGMLAGGTLAFALGVPVARAQTDADAQVQVLNQGWTVQQRDTFYWASQGSHMMPYAWFAALERAGSTERFLADGLARYGYLPPHASPLNRRNLPVGFTTDNGRDGIEYVGMTCGACHTGQVEYRGKSVRLDGAPTDADFWGFLRDLTAAMRETAADAGKFERFARAVLGNRYSSSRAADLRTQFQTFTTRFGDFMDAALPQQSWGPARLDAFGMIFNRLVGLDLNVPANVQPADAPVSYPFMWNAHQQDKIQWNGLAPNGNDLTALARNTGEVLGVFAALDICRDGRTAYGDRCVPLRKPLKYAASSLLKNEIFYNGSASLSGLLSLENSVKALKPPSWPSTVFGPVDPVLAGEGKPLFQEYCAGCHGMSVENNQPGQIWKVQTVDVGTDPVMIQQSGRMAKTGIMEGTRNLRGLLEGVPPEKLPRFGAEDRAATILSSAVLGTIIDGWLYPNPRGTRIDLPGLLKQAKGGSVGAADERKESELTTALAATVGETFKAPAGSGAAYESRPLYGIWATPPFLHNGSVRSLWELMRPEDRPETFTVAKRTFDPKTVGIASDVTDGWTFDTRLKGNGKQGHAGPGFSAHDDGRAFSDREVWAIIEYMKTLDGPEDL